MNRSNKVVLGVLTATAIAVFTILSPQWIADPHMPFFGEAPTETDAKSADADDETASRAERFEEIPAVRLTIEEQRYTGLRTETLEKTEYRPELSAFATVLDLRPLLAARAEFEAARARRAVAEANLSASQEAYERLALLHSEDANISARELQQVKSRWRADQVQLTAAERQMHFLRAKTAQRWGGVLTAWAFNDSNAPIFERLVERRSILALLTLDAEQSLPADTDRVHVERNGNRAIAREARLISPAPVTGPGAQGETYFIYADDDGLRTGMRLRAWIPMNETAVTGVSLPSSAGVWYAGRPWAYVQVDNELFIRRPIANHQEGAGGWFVPAGFEPGEIVVTYGAQMLLSEEFRAQIPEEDDD